MIIENFMKINEGKTELLLLGKKRILDKNVTLHDEMCVAFGDETITPTQCTTGNWKSLGVLLDPSLNFERQINAVKKSCSYTMNDLWTVGKYLNTATKLMLVKQLVLSKLDYCNIIYFGLPKTILKRLQSILNHCIRYIYNVKDRSTDLTMYFKEAHILPISERIRFKVCLLAYKVVNNIAPTYLMELVKVECDVIVPNNTLERKRLRSGEDNLRLVTPKLADIDSKLSNRRFTYYCPIEWNKLPLEIRSSKTTDTFKSGLKTHLFKTAWSPET